MSSSLVADAGCLDTVEGASAAWESGLYAIVTLRLDFHMGSVECVTCHVPKSQSMDGGVKVGDWIRWRVVGGRREI